MIEEIRDLYAYDRWANRRQLDATASLGIDDFTRDLRNSFPSIRDTLAHILKAEWIWLERWRGTSPTGFPAEWDLSTHGALVRKWGEVEAEQLDFLSTLSDESLHRDVDYRSIAGDRFVAPLWKLMRHVANHSTYHRGQVVTMLRQVGAAAPITDMVQFHRDPAG